MISKRTAVLIFSSYFICSLTNAQNSPAASPSGAPVLLEINGAKLTAADIERTRSGPLFQARNTFFQAQRKAVEEFVDDYLLEREAKKENITVPELIDRHVTSTLPKDPSDDAMRVYYEGLNTTEPFEVMRPQILKHIRDNRLEKAKVEYVRGLRAKANIAVHLAAPKFNISLNDTPVRGPADAKVVVVEYADYECPYCQQVQPALDKLEAEYKGTVEFAYKDVPLPMHPHAQKASEAARCAESQGKFWEYHDRLYATKQLDVPQLKETARALNLDMKAFDKCLDSGEKAGSVKAHLAEAQGFQLQGTPGFFINGRFYSGGLPYEQFKAIVDDELKALKSGTEAAVR